MSTGTDSLDLLEPQHCAHPVAHGPFVAALCAWLLLGCGAADAPADPSPPAGGAGVGAGGSGAAAGATTTSTTGAGGGGHAPGSLTDGAELELVGVGFGDKVPAAPRMYDGFESGAVGTPLAGWQWYGNTATGAVYGADQPFAGQQSAFIDFPDGTYANGAFVGGLGVDEIYFSYRVLVHDGGGSDPNPQLKYGRVTSADVDEVHGALDIGMTHVGDFTSGGANWYNSGSEVPDTFYGLTPGVDRWSRIEHYLRLSRPAGAANGKRWSKVDLRGGMTYSGFPGHFADPMAVGVDAQAYDGADLVTLPADATVTQLQNALLPFFTRAGQLLSVWVDEVYLDSTQARVELGDAPGWSDCTDRAPQPAVAWSDTAITVRLNRGRLAGDAFGFVVTADGTIIELGRVGAWP